ncbi:hypothetical protein [Streptomyces sp. AK02-01A]|uniref:hypothetical protein n=1 Tax=Streptomyces sp. AK02-01A TaxID=3028648 RepID=UPI0029A25838|nr:hypothetical protein [Streptomyces sp. AK02-01A]MDX3853943.1 hypothetical protein [Streptomyces sp. AK02-01A]
MKLTSASALRWAHIILRQLGDPAGHTLNATAVVAERESEAPATESAFTSRLRVDGEVEPGEPSSAEDREAVLVTLAFDDDSSTSVFLEESLTEDEAVALLAEQLQESVLEHTGGTPAPPCPGHSHPAVPEVVDGVASWTCPEDGSTRPILPVTAG